MSRSVSRWHRRLSAGKRDDRLAPQHLLGGHTKHFVHLTLAQTTMFQCPSGAHRSADAALPARGIKDVHATLRGIRFDGSVWTCPVASQTGGALVRIHSHLFHGNPDRLVWKVRHQVGKHGLGLQAGLFGITFVMATAHEVHASASRSHGPVPNVAGLQVSLQVKGLA
jgi:hypothetical protein